MEDRPQDRPWWGVLLGVAAGGVAFKVILLLSRAFPFNSDEAVVGLMARHILRGDWPVFFYGQAYMGSLDATLVAALYRLTGAETVGAIRAVQVGLYAATIITGMWLARTVSGDRRAALFAGALMALPVVNVTLYTTVSLGGYGEALLIGNLLMLCALGFSRSPDRSWLAVAWGGLAGFGLWVFGITLVFVLPTGVLVLRSALRSRTGRELLGLGLGLLAAASVGASPWLWAAVQQGPQAFVGELLGTAIAGASPAGLLAAAASHLAGLVLFGPTVVAGLRPPWGPQLLAVPLAPIAGGFWLVVVYFALRSLRGASQAHWMLFGVAVTTLLGLVITPFGGDPSGRYFLPLLVPLSLVAGEFLTRLRSRGLAWVLLAAVLTFNLASTLQAAGRPPGITTQFNAETRVDTAAIDGLAAELDRLGESRGYTTYWISYPLAFLSLEQEIFVPALPYHLDFRYTDRDNRYPPYNGMVESSPRVAYITFRQPALDRRIRNGLEGAGIEWQEAAYGGYQIFYRLSEPIAPPALELGLKE